MWQGVVRAGVYSCLYCVFNRALLFGVCHRMLLWPTRVASSRCKSSAVPSSCHTLADAKGLPPAVFVCDKKDVFVAEK